MFSRFPKITYEEDVSLLNFKNRPYQNTAIIGISDAGKSTLLKFLFFKYYNKKDNICTLFTSNPHIDHYKDFDIVYIGFDHTGANLIQQHHEIQVESKNKYKFVEMFDDVLNARRDGEAIQTKLILTYRNANMSSISSIQDPMLLSPDCRANVNNIFIFTEGPERAEFIVKHYLKYPFEKMGIIGKSNQLAFYLEATQNYGFIYLQPRLNHISFHRLKI